MNNGSFFMFLNYIPQMSFTSSPAIISPATLGTNEMLAGIGRELSPSSDANEVIASSFE